MKTEKNDKSLVIENSNSNQLVQKVSPSSKRKAPTMSNAELLAEKAVVKDQKGRVVCTFRRKGGLYVCRTKLKSPFARRGP